MEFDISSKKITNSPKRNRYTSVWSADEQNNKLAGYLEISSDAWVNIKYGSHIRYITKDNEFKSGGFVLKNPFIFNRDNGGQIKPNIKLNVEEDHNKTTGIKLQSTLARTSPDYRVWVLAYDDIFKIFLKVDASIKMIISSLENTIETTNINLRKVSEYIKKLEERIKKLESK